MKNNWNAIEDEVLKLSVLKFGIYKWEKISTGFYKKSTVDCKMRWFRWLDYRIKKEKWKFSEDKRLIFLSAIYKGNFKLISYFIRRSSLQTQIRLNCLFWSKNFQKNKLNFKTFFFTRKLKILKFSSFLGLNKEIIELEKKTHFFDFRTRMLNNRGKKKLSKFIIKRKNLSFKKETENFLKKNPKKFSGIDYYSNKEKILSLWFKDLIKISFCMIRGSSVSSVSIEDEFW